MTKVVDASRVGVWICTSKNRKRIYSPTEGKKSAVYLKDDDNFEIEIYNPTNTNCKIEIRLDNKPATGSGGIMIRRGQRVYLDCFVDTLRKFVYKTYKVDDNKENKDAIVYNGLVEVWVYPETVYVNTSTSWLNSYPNTYNYYYISNTRGPISGTFTTTGNVSYSNHVTGDIKIGKKRRSMSKKIETGQVEQGAISDTNFDNYFGNFSSIATQYIRLYILPESNRPVDVKELKKKKKKKAITDNTKIAEASLNNNTILNSIHSSMTLISDLKDKKLITDTEYESLRKKYINSILV